MSRKPREATRKQHKKESYDKVLIVCEGQKTEPNYFEEIKDKYEISSLNIVIDGDCGSSPLCVVNHAKKIAKKEADLGSSFDKVFCVIDKDNHESYPQAMNKIMAQKGQVFKSIESIPCFEYWLLLHFEYTTRAYISQQGNSVGAQVVRDLKKLPGMGDYEKGKKGVFYQLLDRLDQAKLNAARALKSADRAGTDNPITKIHTLIQYLEDIKKA